MNIFFCLRWSWCFELSWDNIMYFILYSLLFQRYFNDKIWFFFFFFWKLIIFKNFELIKNYFFVTEIWYFFNFILNAFLNIQKWRGKKRVALVGCKFIIQNQAKARPCARCKKVFIWLVLSVMHVHAWFKHRSISSCSKLALISNMLYKSCISSVYFEHWLHSWSCL